MLRFSWALFILASTAATAQPTTKFTAVFPDWFQRGTTNEITLSGENIRDAKSIHVSGDAGVQLSILPAPPLKATVMVESSRGGILVSDGSDPNKIRASLVVSTDAPLNLRELRIVTGSGVSNPLKINVSSMREIAEAHSGSEPQKIELPIGITGVIRDAGEIDTYQFSGEKGQDLIFDVLAFRVGSALDSSLIITDPAGNELARSEDARGFDSFLRFRVPENGEYRAQLRDLRYSGSAEHRYHLIAGAVPYVESVFPVGARRGQAIDIVLQGVNLGGVDRFRLQPEANAPLGWQEIRVRTPNGLSSPFAFQVSDLPEMTEVEPNSGANQSTTITVPGTMNGRISPAKDVDNFKFKLDKPQRLICEVTAQRFGSPLDALLILREPGGKVLQQNDDADGADARIEFDFQKDQPYVLSVRDLLGRGGEEYVYRLSIRAPEQDFAVRFYPDSPRLYCGGRTMVQCEVTRKAGFGGAVRVSCEQLPPGVTAEPVLMSPEDPSRGVLMLTAAGSVPGGIHPFRIVAAGTIEGMQVSRTAEAMSGDRAAKEGLLTVLESAPAFALDLATLSIVLEQDQTSTLDVLVRRRDNYTGEIKLTADGFTAGREPLSQNAEFQPVTNKFPETHATLKLKARQESEVGSRLIYVKGDALVDGQGVSQFSQTIPLTIRQIPFTLSSTMKRLSVAALPPGAKSAASEAEFAIRCSRRGWFTEQINLTLEGLPEGITATSTNLPSLVNEAAFKLTATDKAPPAKEFKLTIVGTATAGGRTYQQRTEPITLNVTAPQDLAEAK